MLRNVELVIFMSSFRSMVGKQMAEVPFTRSFPSAFLAVVTPSLLKRQWSTVRLKRSSFWSEVPPGAMTPESAMFSPPSINWQYSKVALRQERLVSSSIWVSRMMLPQLVSFLSVLKMIGSSSVPLAVREPYRIRKDALENTSILSIWPWLVFPWPRQIVVPGSMVRSPIMTGLIREPSVRM